MRGEEGKGAARPRGRLGPGEKRGKREPVREGERGFGLVAGLLLSFLSFFLFYTQPFKQAYLNSKKT
jgi:hypothetical protein